MLKRLKQYLFKLFFLFDRLLFKGKIRSRLWRIDTGHTFLQYGKPHYIDRIKTQVGRSVILRVPTRDLIMMQLYYPARFRNWDMAIHYLYIEYLNGKNAIGEELERKLQKIICGNEDISHIRDFILHTGETNNKVKIIEVDRDMRLIDGSLDLAIAWYKRYNFVKVCCCDTKLNDYIYGRDLLLSAGFSKQEIDLVSDKVEEIIESSRYLNTCILWTPAINLFDEMIQALQEYHPQNIIVKNWFDVQMSFQELSGFLKLGYKKDDCIDYAIRMKSDYMYKASKVDNDVYTIRIVQLKMLNPDYIVKPISGMPYSQESLRCKETLRSIYKHQIENYERDVAIHISDNYLQSNYIWRLTQINRDISGLFALLRESNISYQVSSFYGNIQNEKYVFTYGEESKIIIQVSSDQVSKTISITEDFAKEHFCGEWVKVKHQGEVININLEGELIFVFDIISKDGE